MAQLKDSIVSGNLRVTDSTLTDVLQTDILKVRTSSSASIYGPGTNGQVLKSNGTNAYWDAITQANIFGASAIGGAKNFVYYNGSSLVATTQTLGTSTKPLYLSSGTFTECSSYAGGTAVTLNNASKAASTASFYAPTAGGTAGYLLIGKGTTTAPDWSNVGFIDATNSRFGIGTTSPAYKLDVNGTTHTTSLIVGTTTDAKNVSLVWDDTAKAWHLNGNFYADGFISAGGLSNGSGTSGIDEAAMWESLSGNTGAGYNQQINIAHLSNFATSLNLGAAANYAVASSVTKNDTTHLVTGAAVWTAIDSLPEPMIFKGSLGTNGTVASLPTASSANEGHTYKVITAGTYASQAAKIGDLFISNGTSWIWIPSGDEPSGTVTSVALAVPTGLSVSGSPITTSGTLTISLTSGYTIPTSSDVSNGVTAYGYFSSGVLPYNHGGTGQSSWTKGQILYASANNTLAKLDANSTTTKKFLSMTSSAPSWVTLSASDIGSLSISSGTITIDSNTITPVTAVAVGGSGHTNEIAVTSGGSTSYITIPFATVASKLSNTAKVGDTNKPVYFTANGVPAAISYTIDKSVPSNAVFTDTWRNIYISGTEKQGTGTGTKGINFVNDGKTTITYLPAGTGTDQSGNANYATIKISSTWRGIQNNLTSDSTTDSLSAAQGKALKASITTLEQSIGNYVLKAGDSMSGWLAFDNNIGVFGKDSGSNNRSILYLNNSNHLVIGNGLKDVSSGGSTYLRGVELHLQTCALAGTYADRVIVNSSGNVTLGNADSAASSYKLYVTGATKVTGQFYLGTSSVSSFNFVRGSANYFTAPADGYFAFVPNGLTSGVSNSSLVVTAGSIYPGAETDLGRQSSYWHYTYTNRICLADNVYIENTSNGVYLFTNGKGFYTDGFVSAGGLSNGSGTGGVDIDAVWSSLTNSSSDDYASTKIHTNHLPTIEISGTNVTSGSGTYTYTSASSAKLALTINVKDTTYSVVSSSANGLAPKTGSDASATIATQSTEWVLTTTSGGTPTWRKLPSAAFSTGTDVNVKVNNTNPTSGTWYYPTWYTATSGTGNVNANDGFRYYSLQGTTSAAGRTILAIGNATASGTAGNKYGEIWIYSTNTKVGQILTTTLDDNRSYTLPNASGTFVIADASQALTNKTYNGYTLAAACAKSVVTTIDTSASLPTSKAVKDFVEGKGYVLTGTAQTITAKHTFSNGFVLTTATSWTNSDRSIPFSVDSDDSNIRYYYTDSTKGLTYNPNTGAVKAAKFISRSGGSGFLKADGTEDTTNYLKGTSNSNVAIRATDSSNTWGAVGFAEGDNTKYNLYSIRFGATPGASFGGSQLAYGSGIMFGGTDTRGFIALKYSAGHVEFGGGSVSAPTVTVGWHFGINGTDGVTYDLPTIASNASNGNTAYNSLGDYLLKSGGTMTGELYLKYANPRLIFQAADGTVHGNIAVRSAGVLEFYDLTAYRTVYHSGNFTPGNYVLKSGDTMSGDLIIQKTGGGLTIRGASDNANANGGYIYLAGRYSSGERNGCKIASIYPGSGAYDIQDLVFYSSDNRSGNAAPIWVEAMRIKANASVTINQAENIIFKNGYGVKVMDNVDTPSSYGILYMSSNNNLILGYNSAIAGYNTYIYGNNINLRYGTSALVGVVLNDSGNVSIGSSDVAGTSTKLYVGGSITLAYDNAIRWLNSNNTSCTVLSLSTSNNIYLGYGSSGEGSNTNIYGVETKFYTTTSRTLSATLDSTGLSLTGNLTVAGTSTFNDTINVENRKYMQWKDSGGTYRNVFGLNNADNLLIGYSLSSVTGSATTIYGEAVRLQATDVNEIIKTGGATLVMRGTQLNNQVHTILFRGSDTDSNGFKIQTTAAGSYGRQSLGFYRSNVTSGSSPYTPVWKRSLYMPYDGGVVVGTSSDACSLTVYGDITTSNNMAIDNAATRTLNFLVRTGNTGAGNIFFQANYNGTAGYNGFKISSVQAAYASRQDLVFYRSNNTTSPYTFTPTEILRLTYDGHVKVTGDIQSTGDQVVSSDACLKKNFGRINYSVSDIAACRAITFDWKDGRGRSAGSIAQDWKPLIPELVHGEDGNMTLAYGQIALINSIIIARHENEQDKKIEELENRIVALENEIDLLRNGIR